MITIHNPATKIALAKGALGFIDVELERFPDHIQTYIYDYGLRQVLNDVLGDRKDEDKKPLATDVLRARSLKRLDALYAGTIRTRGEAVPADPVEWELFELVRASIHDNLTKLGTYKKVAKGTKNRLLTAMNIRRRERDKPIYADESEMVADFLATMPHAKAMREEAERNVREREERATAVGDFV